MDKDKKKIQSMANTIISFLRERGMGDLIEEIGGEMVRRGREESERVYVYTASKLSDSQVDKLRKFVVKKIGNGKKEYEFIVDKKIIDGLIVKYKDKKWDMSLLGQIRKIRESI